MVIGLSKGFTTPGAAHRRRVLQSRARQPNVYLSVTTQAATSWAPISLGLLLSIPGLQYSVNKQRTPHLVNFVAQTSIKSHIGKLDHTLRDIDWYS
jgi:hypothetical protein